MKIKKRAGIQKMILCSLFAALIAVGAFIRIPVPFSDYCTMQFFFVVLAGLMLGASGGAAAAGLYVALGLAGLPVLAAGGGISYVLRPTFGYLLGFIAGAWLCGKTLAAFKNGRKYGSYLAASIVCLVVTYAVGLAYKYLILRFYIGTPVSFIVLLATCFPLEIPSDLASCALAAFVAVRMERAGIADR